MCTSHASTGAPDGQGGGALAGSGRSHSLLWSATDMSVKHRNIGASSNQTVTPGWSVIGSLVSGARQE